MQTSRANLIKMIIGSASGQTSPYSGLTPDEEETVTNMVNCHIGRVAKALADSKSKAPRSEFKLEPDVSKQLEAQFRVQLFPGKKSKISHAVKLARAELAHWEKFIQVSPMVAQLEESFAGQVEDEPSSPN